MRVVIGSKNPPKVNAVKSAFEDVFPADEIMIECVGTESNVSSHPTSAEESIQGALNRAVQASRQIVGADYYVGIEGGLLRVGERAWEIGWVVIRSAEGRVASGLSSGIELRGNILKAIVEGVELNDVLEKDFGLNAAGSRNGFYGFATNDSVTRQEAYEQGVKVALAQFVHPEFYRD